MESNTGKYPMLISSLPHTHMHDHTSATTPTCPAVKGSTFVPTGCVFYSLSRLSQQAVYFIHLVGYPKQAVYFVHSNGGFSSLSPHPCVDSLVFGTNSFEGLKLVL